MTDGNRLNFLTGIRGYAALGVVLIHIFGIFTPGIHPIILNIIYLGPNGVMVFFVLSAFTIALSLENRKSCWVTYAIKRFFRIAPAYYLMLVIVFFGRESSFAAQFNTPFDKTSFLFHLSFLNWFDYRHANNALGVEWTLSIEMLFYALLPLMVWLSRNTFGALLLIAACASIHALQPVSNVVEVWKWSPAPYATCFAAGVVAFRHWNKLSNMFVFRSGAVLLVTLALVFVVRPSLSFTLVIFWWTAATVCLIFSGRSKFSSILFENRFSLWLGERSYSIYLVHLPLLEMIIRKQHGPLGAALTLCATFAAAYVLHRWVEVPGIAGGRAIVSLIEEKRHGSQSFEKRT
jgi:peptidoglycan/LPS O-acetylase OafA/YrhL